MFEILEHIPLKAGCSVCRQHGPMLGEIIMKGQNSNGDCLLVVKLNFSFLFSRILCWKICQQTRSLIEQIIFPLQWNVTVGADSE